MDERDRERERESEKKRKRKKTWHRFDYDAEQMNYDNYKCIINFFSFLFVNINHNDNIQNMILQFY